MCIICVKPQGIVAPSRDIFSNCFSVNSDGAGIAYVHNGKVHISKGLMNIADFNKKLTEIEGIIDTTKESMIFHFRIGTHGSKNNPVHTHPFPLVEDFATMEVLDGEYDGVVAHNGVLNVGTLTGSNTKSYTEHGKNVGPSDTMEMISNILYPLSKLNGWAENEKIKKLIKHTLGYNKVVYMNGEGKIVYLSGEFEEKDGIYYSNKSYETKVKNNTTTTSEDDYIDNYRERGAKLYKDEYSRRVSIITARYRKNTGTKNKGYDKIEELGLLRWYIPVQLCVSSFRSLAYPVMFDMVDPDIAIYVDKKYKYIYYYDEPNDELSFLGYLVNYVSYSDDYIYNNLAFGYATDFRKGAGLVISPIFKMNERYWADRTRRVSKFDIKRIMQEELELSREVALLEGFADNASSSENPMEIRESREGHNRKGKKNKEAKEIIVPINGFKKQGSLLDYDKGSRYNGD